MKKIELANYCALTLLLSGFATSCQEYDLGVTTEAMSYSDAFINEFGQPSPNHDYGFIDQEVINYDLQTRAVNTNSNEWGKMKLNVPGNQYVATDQNNGYYIHPDGTTGSNPMSDVTQDEIDYVYNYFSQNLTTPSKAIHWDSFFIQYVTSWDAQHHNSDRTITYVGYKGIYTDWEHVNNFNGDTRAMQYVYKAGTEDWTYWAARDSKQHDNLYHIEYLEFTVNGKDYAGWYIGFDYTATNSAGESKVYVEADGIFNDYIVKVSPGTSWGYPTTVRVMCEDLGSSFDWDFNDVVFDVSFRKENGKTYARIVLQAVGGTMPIYIGTTDAKYEAHALLGDGSMTPIIHPDAVAIYDVEVSGVSNTDTDNTINAKKIPIYVHGGEAIYTIQNSITAQKFACPDDVQWTEELQNICNLYPNVPSWIQNKDMGDAKDIWTVNPKK